jgi:hypothetical protein
VEAGNDEEAKESAQECVPEVVTVVEDAADSHEEDELEEESRLSQRQVEVGVVVKDEEGEEGPLGCVTRGQAAVRFLGAQVQQALGTVRNGRAGAREEALREGGEEEDHEDLEEVLEGDEGWSGDVGFIKVIIIAFVISLNSDTLFMVFFALLFLEDR